MLTTQTSLEALSERIERAYQLRRPEGVRNSRNSPVWEAAASCLLGAHRDDPNLPIDPELYVAAQPASLRMADPWQALTDAGSVWRYRRLVRRIVRDLRDELRGEVRKAIRQLRQGESAESVLSADDRNFSPLGRYIVALRAGRPDIADVFRDEAIAQHRACPLYRQAAKKLLPRGSYPVFEIIPGLVLRPRAGADAPVFSLN